MKKLMMIGLITLITILSVTTLTYASSAGPVFRVAYNIDRPGADIQQGFASNLGGCMNNCASSSRCRAFTWVPVRQQPPNFSNAEPLCWLKSSIPGVRINPGMVTGVKEGSID